MTLSPEDLRNMVRGAARQLPSGVALVIAMVDGTPHAATASSGMVVSLEPPLFALFFAVGSRMHRALASSDSFTVNLLRQSDHALASHFANPARARSWDGLAGLDLTRRDPAPPILARAAVWFDCRLRQVTPMGDHSCFVGEVVDCAREVDAAPLIYCRGRFFGMGHPVAPAPWTNLDRSDLVAEW